jgi:hypothetical protein
MDLRASIQVWLQVLRTPGEAVMTAEMQKPYARLGTAVVWLVASGLVTVLIWILVFMLLDPMGQSMAMMPDFLAEMGFSEAESEEMVTQMEATAQMSMFLMLCGMLVGIPTFALAWSGLLWLMARLVGGVGNYEKQTFLLASFTAPLVVLSTLAYLFPLLGLAIVMGLAVYNLYLTFLALKVVHELPKEKAVTAVLAPTLVVFAAGCCALTLWLALLGAALNAA